MSEPSSLDDVALMALVAEANTGALGELYDRYRRLVFSLALAIVGDRAVAEEIAVDVFVLVWRRAGTYQPDKARVSTWLIAITRNHAIDILRHRATRPEPLRLDWEHTARSETHSGHEIEDRVERTQRRERVRAAIAQLPDDQRDALALAFFGGYSHAEIAEMRATPLGTVKTRIRLAMHKLRDLLSDEHKSA